MDNKTERYMVIFNDVGLTIKGYYNEIITPIQRHKILDRLYSLIHNELFEGMKPLETETSGDTTVIPQEQTTTVSQNEDKPKKVYKKRGRPKRVKREPKVVSVPTPVTSTPESPKDPFDNEKDDNQFNEFKKKGII